MCPARMGFTDHGVYWFLGALAFCVVTWLGIALVAVEIVRSL